MPGLDCHDRTRDIRIRSKVTENPFLSKLFVCANWLAYLNVNNRIEHNFALSQCSGESLESQQANHLPRCKNRI